MTSRSYFLTTRVRDANANETDVSVTKEFRDLVLVFGLTPNAQPQTHSLQMFHGLAKHRAREEGGNQEDCWRLWSQSTAREATQGV